jgi:polysaccharide export outer membrane protein
MGVALRGLCLISFVWAVGCASCAHQQPHYDYAKEPDPRHQEYVLGPSDVIRINVWRDSDLSGEAVVRPDGAISLPLIGDIRAAGRTPEQVRVEVTQRLATFIKDQSAVVTVAVSAINSYRFTVSGMVEHAGAFSSNHYVTVSEAIVLAGGPNKYATPEEAVIIRQDPGRAPKRIPIDYPSILAGLHPEQDLVLLAGDNVYLP